MRRAAPGGRNDRLAHAASQNPQTQQKVTRNVGDQPELTVTRTLVEVNGVLEIARIRTWARLHSSPTRSWKRTAAGNPDFARAAAQTWRRKFVRRPRTGMDGERQGWIIDIVPMDLGDRTRSQ